MGIGAVCLSTPTSAVLPPGCRIVLGRVVNCNVHVWPQHKLCSIYTATLKRMVNPEASVHDERSGLLGSQTHLGCPVCFNANNK